MIQDETGGLELFDRLTQQWRPIKPVRHGVLVNTADLLMQWTNNKLPSTLHRVVPTQMNVDRYSLVYFVNPNKEVVVDPTDIFPEEETYYETISASDYLYRRLSATFQDYDKEEL